MNTLNIGWPDLCLTEREARYVAHYKFPDHEDEDGREVQGQPGVLRRAYPLELVFSTIPGEQSVPSVSFRPSGRYTRVFALTFSGDIAWISVDLVTNPGENLIVDPGSVSSLLNVADDGDASFAPASQAGLSTEASNPARVSNGGPMVFEPNILVEGTATLVFNGSLSPRWIELLPNPTDAYRAVLNILVHVWEFPDLPRQRGIGGVGEQSARSFNGTKKGGR